MAINAGMVLAPELHAKLFERIKRTIPEAVWALHMQGNRMLIAQDKAEDMYHGVLHKPARVVEKEQTEAASGWVIAVGPRCGDGTAPHPRGIESESAQDLLGLHVYYQMWAGKVFRTDEGDAEFGGRESLIILTDRDVQAYDERIE